jgi:hypothetical protein
MRPKLISCLLILSVCSLETVAAVGQAVGSGNGTGTTITIPAGRSIPLTLVSQVKSKSSKPGDMVRAQVAFPVSEGGQVVIPAGTFVEGILGGIDLKQVRKGKGGLQIHFTRLIYANGYTIPLDAVNTVAELNDGATAPLWQSAGAGPGIGIAAAMLPLPIVGLHPFYGQTPTPTPTLPSLPGPPTAFIVAFVVGAVLTLGILIVAIAFHGHAGNADMLLYDGGYQFAMRTSSPLILDVAQVAAASAIGQQ